MQTLVPQPPLKGSKALIVGVANEHSIAYGCAKAFRNKYGSGPSQFQTPKQKQGENANDLLGR